MSRGTSRESRKRMSVEEEERRARQSVITYGRVSPIRRANRRKFRCGAVSGCEARKIRSLGDEEHVTFSRCPIKDPSFRRSQPLQRTMRGCVAGYGYFLVTLHA